MGSIGRTDLQESRCCLPISEHEPASNPTWQYIAVRLPDGKQFPDIHTEKFLLDRDATLRSWAVLIRCYTGTGLVFFAELYNSHIVEANNRLAGPDARSVGDAIRILQYQLSDNLELQRISEDDSRLHGEAATERRITNTAVHISGDFYNCSEANGRQTLSETCVKLTNLDHVGRLFSIIECSDGKKSFLLTSLAFLFCCFCGLLRVRKNLITLQNTIIKLRFNSIVILFG